MGSDADQITKLVYRYAEMMDGGDLAGVAGLFADASFRTQGRPDVRRGSAQVLETFQQMVILYDGKPSTRHVTTNLMVEVDESRQTASARSYFSVLQARPELPLQIIIAGRYHDRFERVASGWRFSDRVIIVDLIGDLRYHLKQSIQA